MKQTLSCISILLSLHCIGQTPEQVVVTTQSINIIGSLTVGTWLSDHPGQVYPDYPKIYYGFAEGDEIVIDVTTENKKGTQLLEVSEYESKSVVYSNNGFQTLEAVRIKVPKTSVYKFEFATNHVFDRQCKVTIKRIPASVATSKFNCNVTWKIINDTTFTTVEEKRETEVIYEPVTLHTPTDYFINGGFNATFMGGKSRITFPITLPPNTVEWYYSFGATREDDEVQSTKSSMHLLDDLSKALDQTGILSIALNVISQPPGADYCDVYLLKPEHFQPFINKEAENWRYITEGSRQNLMSGVVKVKNCCTTGNYYIGIKNPVAGYGLHVMIEIVAITEKATYQTVQVKKPVSVIRKKIPVFGI